MSFLNIKDKRKRDAEIKDYLALKKRLKRRNMEDREETIEHYRDLEEQYAPVVASNERMADTITEQLVPIKDQMHQIAALVNQPIPRQQVKAEPDLSQYGPLVQNFAASYMEERVRQAEIDTTFGIRYENAVWKIGNKKVSLNLDDSMTVGDEDYEGTPGFWSLVTEKHPTMFTDDDLARYKELLYETSALHQDYDEFDRYPRASKSKKWKNILGPIWNEFQFTGVVNTNGEEDQTSFFTNEQTADDSDQTMSSTTGGNGVKMYLQKKGRCYALNKTMDGGIKLRPRPKLAGVHADGLYLRHGSNIFHGEGLILGKNSPFRNIPILGWIL